MKITLCDINYQLVREWGIAFNDISNDKVEVVCQDIFLDPEAKFDAIVSPSNSYGYLDGGIDLVFSKHFGWQVQERLQAKIALLPMKELLVGESLVVSTGNKYIPNIISSPTMRIGMNVSDTVNAYLAFKSTLIAAKQHKFSSILCPGLGTAVGQMKPEICAKQMRNAYNEVILGKIPIFSEFYEAAIYQRDMSDISRRNHR